jgi:hypothetical protein
VKKYIFFLPPGIYSLNIDQFFFRRQARPEVSLPKSNQERSIWNSREIRFGEFRPSGRQTADDFFRGEE